MPRQMCYSIPQRTKFFSSLVLADSQLQYDPTFKSYLSSGTLLDANLESLNNHIYENNLHLTFSASTHATRNSTSPFFLTDGTELSAIKNYSIVATHFGISLDPLNKNADSSLVVADFGFVIWVVLEGTPLTTSSPATLFTSCIKKGAFFRRILLLELFQQLFYQGKPNLVMFFLFSNSQETL